MLDKETYNILKIDRSPSSKEADNPRGRTRFNAYQVDKNKKNGNVYIEVNGQMLLYKPKLSTQTA
jgi:hypothetical protein|tara:strand:+ start:1300 stop:1494 length:195 start_codon:yes stop_codon:yes gene_type:complete